MQDAGLTSVANAVSNTGLVVGATFLSGVGEEHDATFNSDGSITSIGNLGLSAHYSNAYAINDRGQIVGDETLADGSMHAFLPNPRPCPSLRGSSCWGQGPRACSSSPVRGAVPIDRPRRRASPPELPGEIATDPGPRMVAAAILGLYHPADSPRLIPPRGTTPTIPLLRDWRVCRWIVPPGVPSCSGSPCGSPWCSSWRSRLCIWACRCCWRTS